jgi:hypothetical protein
MLGLGGWTLVMQDEVVAKLERWFRAQVKTHRSLSQLEPLESRDIRLAALSPHHSRQRQYTPEDFTQLSLNCSVVA